MSTRTVRLRRDDAPDDWSPIPERAPSALRESPPTIARFLSLVGLFLAACGVLALLAPVVPFQYPISPPWGFFCLSLGAMLLLFHCVTDAELQFRRVYGVAAVGLLLSGPALRLFPNAAGTGAWFLPIGAPLMFVGLTFALGVLRNEDDRGWRWLLRAVLASLGWIAAAAPLVLAFVKVEWMPTDGAVALAIGLALLASHAAAADPSGDGGFATGLVLGGLALAYALAAGIGLWRGGQAFLVPSGVLLIAASILYGGFALGICSDRPTVVLFRRELGSLFYSPVAYLVLLCLAAFAWIIFMLFVDMIVQASQPGRRGGIIEPITPYYLAGALQIIPQLIIVPILTMRSLSEEKRTGSLELLLTAPLNEGAIVVGKFLAVWVFYLMTWLPWGFFLLALRIFGDAEFDYRPLLSFYLTMAACGSAFVAMGLFFSGLTRNQIISAVLTFVGMLVFLSFLFLESAVRSASGKLADIVHSASFVHYWDESARGFVSPAFLCAEFSIAAFFLYLTVQVLSARKWS